MLAFHQVSHITALAAHPGVAVTWVVQEALSPERSALGWTVPEIAGVEVVVAPDEAAIRRLVSERPDDSVHVFTGIHQDPVARKAFYLCAHSAAKVGLLVEAPFPGRLRDLISPILHRAHRLFYGKRIRFIIAMGHMAAEFYESVGYSRALIFPYGYFPPAPADSSDPTAGLPRKSEVQLLYLGQLTQRKGVDLLLDALGPLTDLDWRLTIVGSGDQKDTLAALSKQLGLERRLTFYASLENQAAMRLMGQSDLLVLPSRHDGWGVVVNEALMRGVPVICSDNCGSSDLLAESWLGEAFAAGSVPSLKAALRRWISRGRRTPEETEKIRAWSRRIEGDVAARYLLQAIRCALFQEPRPSPPWQDTPRAAAPIERHLKAETT